MSKYNSPDDFMELFLKTNSVKDKDLIEDAYNAAAAAEKITPENTFAFFNPLVNEGIITEEEANEMIHGTTLDYTFHSSNSSSRPIEGDIPIEKQDVQNAVQSTTTTTKNKSFQPVTMDVNDDSKTDEFVADGIEDLSDKKIQGNDSGTTTTKNKSFQPVTMDVGDDSKTDKYVVPGIESLETFSSETKSDTNTEPSPIFNGLISSFGNIVPLVGSKINHLHENITYNSLDAKELNKKILSCREEAGNFRTMIKTCILSFQDLNEDTRKNLEAKGITGDVLEDKLYGFVSTWCNTLDTISSELESKIGGMESFDGTKSDVGATTISSIPKGSSSGSHHTNSSNVSSDPVIEEIKPTDTTVNVALLSSVVGTITFKEIVILYETIGQGEGIPASLSGNYGLIGIIKVEDKYYYKMIDKDTNKVYYTEMNEKVEIKTEIEQVLSIKENAMILKSTDIGSNNFVKLADPSTLYFVQNEVENNGITFANILDSTDGGNYYIPLSDSVELISLESIISSISSNE